MIYSHQIYLNVGEPEARTAQSCSRNGFTLLEILITLLIISMGMLGFAALQIKGLQSNHGAMLSSQAAFLAYDMSERIRANSEVQNKYSIAAATIPPSAYCVSNQCNKNTMAAADIFEWRQLCKELLPEGKGAISWSGQTGTITVSWAEQENIRTFSLVVGL